MPAGRLTSRCNGHGPMKWSRSEVPSGAHPAVPRDDPAGRRRGGKVSVGVVLAAFVVSVCISQEPAPNPAATATNAFTKETPDDDAKGLIQKLDTFYMSVGIRPKKETQDLRSVTLSSAGNSGNRVILVGPPSFWSNGVQVSEYVNVSDSQAVALIQVLVKRGYFRKAGKYYSAGGSSDPQAHPPPSDARDFRIAFPGLSPPKPEEPGYDVDVTVNDSYWITTYRAKFGTSRSDLRLFRDLKKVLNGKPVEFLSALESQID